MTRQWFTAQQSKWRPVFMLTKLAITAFLIATIMMIAPVNLSASAVEQAPYDVLESTDYVEIRRYPETIVAEVMVTADDRQIATSTGFMALAGYIFGQNQTGDKIAMTAPVTTVPVEPEAITTQNVGDKAYIIQFVMPAKWSMESLPAPNNPKVTLKTLPVRYMISTKMVGVRTPERLGEMEAVIAEFINKRNLQTIGDFISAGYDRPSTPAQKRRWELLQQIENPQS
ncbi:MAG: heme-binding protein [Pseudomonadota bacterium]